MEKPVAHRVYWTSVGEAHSKDFVSGDIDSMLKYCESLRQLRKDGQDISFITTASEIPDCTSLQGIAVVGPDYEWKKRRP